MPHIALFIQNFAIRIDEQKLDIAHLGTVNRRIVNFSKNAVPDRKPDSALQIVGRSNTVFVRMTPVGVCSGSAECAPFTSESRHLSDSFQYFFCVALKGCQDFIRPICYGYD